MTAPPSPLAALIVALVWVSTACVLAVAWALRQRRDNRVLMTENHALRSDLRRTDNLLFDNQIRRDFGVDLGLLEDFYREDEGDFRDHA